MAEDDQKQIAAGPTGRVIDGPNGPAENNSATAPVPAPGPVLAADAPALGPGLAPDAPATGPGLAPDVPAPGPAPASGPEGDVVPRKKNRRGVRAGWRVRENKQVELLARLQEKASQIMAQKNWARQRGRGRRGRGGKYRDNQGAP